MVEAVFYIPLVICITVALIYLALFNLQEYLMMYESQKINSVISRELTYPGYDRFGMGQTNEVDFSGFPDAETVRKSFEARNENLGSMYRDVANVFNIITGAQQDVQGYKTRSRNEMQDFTLVRIGTIAEPEIKVENSLLGMGVTVTFKHNIPAPGVYRYLFGKENITVSASSYTYSVNPASFMRTVDLSVDFVEYIAKKLGMDGKLDKLIEICGKVLNIIFGSK